jgi:hypothetical protein
LFNCGHEKQKLRQKQHDPLRQMRQQHEQQHEKRHDLLLHYEKPKHYEKQKQHEMQLRMHYEKQKRQQMRHVKQQLKPFWKQHENDRDDLLLNDDEILTFIYIENKKIFVRLN